MDQGARRTETLNLGGGHASYFKLLLIRSIPEAQVVEMIREYTQRCTYVLSR